MLFTYYISVSYIALYPIKNLICCVSPSTSFAYHNFKLIYIICYIYRLSIYIYTIITIFDIIFSILNSKYPSTIMYIVYMYIIISLSIRAFSLSSFQIVVHSANSLKYYESATIKALNCSGKLSPEATFHPFACDTLTE